MKKLLFTVILLNSVFCIYAQTNNLCGSDIWLQQLKTNDPQAYNLILQTAQQIQSMTGVYKTNDDVLYIPVVVHVVYNTDAQNIPDAMINSEIDVLNADYMRLNADTVNTPAAFQPVAGYPNIQFCMAQRDPSGATSTGITRTHTTTTQWSLFVSGTDPTYSDKVKANATGGIDPWPRSNYLNIWICNLVGGVLGYTTPPGGPANLDGVVIGYKYYGNNSIGGGAYNKGRTATHEIGHWLSLKHPWGDDGGSCSGSDGIADTPNETDATFGCPNFPHLDACSPTSPGVMFMNYMDYVDDDCMNMFTKDQTILMRNTLYGIRASILTSTSNCWAFTGVSQYAAAHLENLLVSPNPAINMFTLHAENFQGPQLTIQVFDILGNMVYNSSVENNGNNEVSVNTSNFNAGEYVLKVSDGKDFLAVEISVVK